MFFWMILASLMGIIMFGNLYEKTKPAEDFVAPVYEAMAMNMLQQHLAVENGYLDSLIKKRTEAEAYFASASDSIIPLATVESGTISGLAGGNVVFPYIQGRLPSTFKPQNGTRSYLFCINKMAQSASVPCSDTNAVRYIVTFRAVPPRYDGADKMTALRSIATITGNSKYVGMLQKAVTPLEADASKHQHQPLGAAYHILAGGVAQAGSAYIPDYIICNAPTSNTENVTLGDTAGSKSYLVAMSLMIGLDKNENLQPGTSGLCSAVSFSP